MGSRIRIRRDTSANWAAANPVLQAGEFGLDIETMMLKVGDGITTWNDITDALYFGVNNGVLQSTTALINLGLNNGFGNGVGSLPHGGARRPDLVYATFVCVVANNGYVVGDELVSVGYRQPQIAYDDVNVYWSRCSNNSTMSPRSFVGDVGVTWGNWRLKIKSIWFGGG